MAHKNLKQQNRENTSSLKPYSIHHCVKESDWTCFDVLPSPLIVLQWEDRVVYLNPAFADLFGWTLEDIEGQTLDFIPDFLKGEVGQHRQGLHREQMRHHLETKGLTKDGDLLDVVLDSTLWYNVAGQPAGQVIMLRDITREKRDAQKKQTLFRIFEKLHHFQSQDELLTFITGKVQTLLNVGGAMIILLDEKTQEFFFRVASLDNVESGEKIREVRFPADKGVAGQVFKTGEPLIVQDTSQSPYFLKQVDDDSHYHTRNMLDVPIETQERRIGVLCAVNKKDKTFDQEDVELLGAIANTIALPLEHARMDAELQQSYDDVQSLNRAKDRVIHHLSHELKTPASVLSASLKLLDKRLSDSVGQQGYKRILDRAQRNLQRILDMQYEIEDILREKEYTNYHLLSILLDACVDELDVLITDETGEWSLMQRVRRRVEELFGPRKSISRKIQLDQFVERQLERLRPRFAHRQCRIGVQIKSTPAILIPPDVLAKVVEGLLRNAIENTPDGSKIDLTVSNGPEGPELEVKDFGIGISEENQRLIFENYFPSYDTMQYSSRKSYDFQAGGKGFDLLRMKIFSERYHFKINLFSRRCGHIPQEKNLCPGNVMHCAYCRKSTDCLLASGTTVTVQFTPADKMPLDEPI